MNLLPLEDFRRIMGLHPFYFYNLTTGGVEPIYPNTKPSSACLAYVRKYAYQGADMLGRDDIEQAIETVEKKLRTYLGHAIAPMYEAQTVMWPNFYDRSRVRYLNLEPSGHYIGIRLPNSGYTQAFGVERLTSIGTVTTGGGGLVYSDSDGDGLNDTFVATMATTVTDPDKIALYFASADRLDGEAASERWRIRPVKVSIAGGVATIRGRYWLLAKPILYEGVRAQPLDPTVLTNFVNSLLVYERTTNPDGETVDDAQATVIWETMPCHGAFCCCSSCCGGGPSYIPADSSFDPSAQGLSVARVGFRDPKMGEVIIGEAFRNSTTGVWSAMGWSACGEPDRAIVRHLSGYPLEDGQVSQKYQTIVARLAAAEMTRPICACEPANRLVHNWSFDLARTGGANDERFAIAEQDLNNPFGTRRGQVAAWREVKALRLTPGMVDH